MNRTYMILNIVAGSSIPFSGSHRTGQNRYEQKFVVLTSKQGSRFQTSRHSKIKSEKAKPDSPRAAKQGAAMGRGGGLGSGGTGRGGCYSGGGGGDGCC
ncbi:hypothetical protein ACRRTK_020056 [Alexandromys fortis]